MKGETMSEELITVLCAFTPVALIILLLAPVQILIVANATNRLRRAPATNENTDENGENTPETQPISKTATYLKGYLILFFWLGLLTIAGVGIYYWSEGFDSKLAAIAGMAALGGMIGLKDVRHLVHTLLGIIGHVVGPLLSVLLGNLFSWIAAAFFGIRYLAIQEFGPNVGIAHSGVAFAVGAIWFVFTLVRIFRNGGRYYKCIADECKQLTM